MRTRSTPWREESRAGISHSVIDPPPCSPLSWFPLARFSQRWNLVDLLGGTEARLESETLYAICAPLFFSTPSFVEPSRASLRRTNRTHRFSRHTAERDMRPSAVFTIIFTAVLTGAPPTFTFADSPGASTTDSQASQSMNAASRNNGASGASTPAAVSQGKAPDCEGTVPSNGVVTALLSRIVRLSSNTQGKQCPIPPVPDHRFSQEPHE